MSIKKLFIRLPKPVNVVIDSSMIDKYRSICNHGKDTYEEGLKRITKAVSLGKQVYKYKDEIIVRYFDINYLLIDIGNQLILKNIWRNKKQGEIVKISEDVKDKWNKKYGLKSHYEQRKESIK